MTHDPHTDPRPGDWLTDADWAVRVDMVRDGLVYVAGFPVTGHASTAAVPLAEWADVARDAAVMVLAEDDPMQARAVIE